MEPKRVRTIAIVIVVLVLFLIFNVAQSTKYYNDLDPGQQRALRELSMNVTAGAGKGMPELLALLHWQARELAFDVPEGYVSERADHGPLAIIGRGWGLCYDRSYVFELMAQSLGYEVRHVALASWDATHAVSEVKVNGSWVLFDTSYNRTYQDENGKYLGVVELHNHREYVEEKNLKPLYEQFVFGVNSFHGGFAPPKIPYPDLAVSQLHYNLGIIPYLPYNYKKVRFLLIGLLVIVVLLIAIPVARRRMRQKMSEAWKRRSRKYKHGKPRH